MKPIVSGYIQSHSATAAPSRCRAPAKSRPDPRMLRVPNERHAGFRFGSGRAWYRRAGTTATNHRRAAHHLPSTNSPRRRKSRVAVVRFWFRQLTPPADNFRHIRSCRRDLALHFLPPPDGCGASRHTNSSLRHKSRYEGSEASSPCGGTPVIIVPSFPSLSRYLLCLLASLAFSFLFLFSLFSFSSNTSTTTMV